MVVETIKRRLNELSYLIECQPSKVLPYCLILAVLRTIDGIDPVSAAESSISRIRTLDGKRQACLKKLQEIRERLSSINEPHPLLREILPELLDFAKMHRSVEDVLKDLAERTDWKELKERLHETDEPKKDIELKAQHKAVDEATPQQSDEIKRIRECVYEAITRFNITDPKARDLLMLLVVADAGKKIDPKESAEKHAIAMSKASVEGKLSYHLAILANLLYRELDTGSAVLRDFASELETLERFVFGSENSTVQQNPVRTEAKRDSRPAGTKLTATELTSKPIEAKSVDAGQQTSRHAGTNSNSNSMHKSAKRANASKIDFVALFGDISPIPVEIFDDKRLNSLLWRARRVKSAVIAACERFGIDDEAVASVVALEVFCSKANVEAEVEKLINDFISAGDKDATIYLHADLLLSRIYKPENSHYLLLIETEFKKALDIVERLAREFKGKSKETDDGFKNGNGTSKQSQNYSLDVYRIEPFVAELAARQKREKEFFLWAKWTAFDKDRTKMKVDEFIVQTKDELSLSEHTIKRVLKRGNGIFWKIDNGTVVRFGVPAVLAALCLIEGIEPKITEIQNRDRNEILSLIFSVSLREMKLHKAGMALCTKIAAERLAGEPQNAWDIGRRLKISRSSVHRHLKAAKVKPERNFELVAAFSFENGTFDGVSSLKEFGERIEKAIDEGKAHVIWEDEKVLKKGGFMFYCKLNRKRTGYELPVHALLRVAPNTYPFTGFSIVTSPVVREAYYKRLLEAGAKIVMRLYMQDEPSILKASAVARMPEGVRRFVRRLVKLGLLSATVQAKRMLFARRCVEPQSSRRTAVSSGSAAKGKAQVWKKAEMSWRAATRKCFGRAVPSLDAVVLEEFKLNDGRNAVVWTDFRVCPMPYGKRLEVIYQGAKGSHIETLSELAAVPGRQYLPFSWLDDKLGDDARASIASEPMLAAKIADTEEARTLLPPDNRAIVVEDTEFRNPSLCGLAVAARRLADLADGWTFRLSRYSFSQLLLGGTQEATAEAFAFSQLGPRIDDEASILVSSFLNFNRADSYSYMNSLVSS